MERLPLVRSRQNAGPSFPLVEPGRVSTNQNAPFLHTILLTWSHLHLVQTRLCFIFPDNYPCFQYCDKERMLRKDNILLKYFLDTLLLKIGRVGGNKWWDEGHWKVPVYNLEPPCVGRATKNSRGVTQFQSVAGHGVLISIDMR